MVATVRERRCWSPAERAVETCVPASRLVRALLDTSEAASMLNAIGRCRPLTASAPRLVVLLNGRPHDLAGVVPDVQPLAAVAAELGVPAPELGGEDARRAALEAANAARIAERAARLEALRAHLSERPAASRRELARALGVADRTLRKLMAELSDAPSLGLGALLGTIRERLEGGGSFGLTLDRETMQRGAEVPTHRLPTSAEVRDELTAAHGRAPGLRDVQRTMGEIRAALASPSGVLVARRSDRAEALARVLRAVAALLERRAPDCAPVAVAPVLPFSPRDGASCSGSVDAPSTLVVG